MFGAGGEHGGVRPTGRAFGGHGGGDLGLVGEQRVRLEGPRARGHDAFVLEVLDLHVGVVPVTLDQGMLAAQHLEHRRILRFVELVRILDAELRLLGLQVQRGIGDVDSAVVGLHATLVRLAVGKFLRLEHHRPGRRRLLEGLGVVQQHVRAPLVRHAIVLAVDVVPGGLLQPLIDAGVAWNSLDGHRLHGAAANQAQRCVTRSRDQVVRCIAGRRPGGVARRARLRTTARHERDHFVRSARGLDRDLATGLAFELRDPVVCLVGLAAFDVARPRDDVERSFERGRSHHVGGRRSFFFLRAGCERQRGAAQHD